MNRPEARLCEFPGCNNRHNAHGLCRAHDTQRRNGLELRPLRRCWRGSPVTPLEETRRAELVAQYAEQLTAEGWSPGEAHARSAEAFARTEVETYTRWAGPRLTRLQLRQGIDELANNRDGGVHEFPVSL